VKRNDVIALSGLLALFIAACLAVGSFHPDRSFVAYRYAENLAAGHGWVYNPGDAPVEGYGNALWVAKCAMMKAAGLPLPVAAPMLSLFFGMVSLVLLWFVLRARVSSAAAVITTGFAAVSGPLAAASMSGEGVTLVAALAVAMVWLLDAAGTRRVTWILAGLVGALLAMCGNPLAVVFPAALVMRVRMPRGEGTQRSGMIIAAAVFAVAVTGFHVWRIATFGSLTPHAPGLVARLASPGELFAVQPFDMAPFGWFYVMLFVAGVARTRFAHDRGLPWVAATTAIVAGVVTLSARDPLPGLASSAVVILLLSIPAAGLVDAVAQSVAPRLARALLALALLLVSLGCAMDARVFARHIRESHDLTLQPLGRWMARWQSDGSLLCDAPGAVPYYSGWRTIPVSASTTLSEAPDVVMLTSEGMFTAEMDAAQTRVADALTERYRVLAAIRRDWTRDRAFILYARNDIPELTDDLMEAFPQGVGTVVRLNR